LVSNSIAPYLHILYVNHCIIIRNICLDFILGILSHFLMYYIPIITMNVRYT
jgi:hypothetical protein